MRTVSLLTLLIALCAPLLASAGEVVDRIVAVVNRDIILSSEFDDTYSMIKDEALRGTPLGERPAAEAQLKLDVLDGLVANKLMEQAMDSAGMSVTEADVEAAMADVARQNNLTVEKLTAELARQGLGLEEYRSELKKQLRQYKFMNLEIRGRVKIADEDILNYYNQMTADVAADLAWRLQMVLLAFPASATDEDRSRIDAEADSLLAEIAGGKDFGEVARARSDDPAGKASGGEAGVVKANELSPLFASKLEDTPIGTAVRVDTPGGVYLLRVAEEVDRARKPLDAVREQISRVLYDEAMERELQIWTEEERRRAHIEILL
ncbi:MAG: SurA N-terminal domain-containing protein [Deltaproteobacteria bacterium]|nr:SurA N-terminal domain-containing protein [Deltaproteobacteria bacterium]